MHDVSAMKNIVRDLYVTMIVQQHGERGARILTHLLESLHQIYQYLAPEKQTHLVIFETINDTDRPLAPGEAMIVRRMESLPQDVGGPAVMQLLENGEILLWRHSSPVSIHQLASLAVVYELNNSSEKFYAKTEMRVVQKPFAGCPSVFAVPTFNQLREALDHYRTILVRYSTCEILTEAWYDPKRLFFRERPEIYIRKSLTQYLLSTLRKAEIRPEQVIDESHPVDIKVTWMLTNRLALIEIKWLGKSLHDDGSEATEYSQSRAIDGAQQLADYLDANKPLSADHETRGYLVVVDGRRRRLKLGMTAIDRVDGLHFADKEITFDSKYEQRGDFEPPIRMFVEPKC